MTPNHNTSPDPLDPTLKALASAAPSPGMEQRILSAIELDRSNSAASSRRPGWLRSTHREPVLAFTFTLALAAVLLAAFVRTRSVGNPELQPRIAAGPRFSMPSGVNATEAATTENPMPKPVLSLSPFPLPTSHPEAAKLQTPLALSHLVDRSAPSSANPDLIAGPGSASFPAPPMPLTQQEKLLLRIAQRDAPEALAARSPEQFAAQQAQDNAAFENFFPPPAPVEYPALLLSQVNQPAVPHGDKP